jgi:thioester reductase-like protein
MAGATAIVHNAYPVNFLLGIQSFEPQLQALVNILQLAGESHMNPAVLLVSSIAAATPVVGGRSTIPETILKRDQAKDLLQQGYAQSKYLCERLIQTYATESKGKRAAVLRVGQVCGPVSGTGTWNMWEWAPSLILSSKFIGALPRSLGGIAVDWVPVDKLGDIVSELISAMTTPVSEKFVVYNIVNPKITPWPELLATLEKVAPEVVPVEEWIDRLEKSDKGPHLISQNPALKLVDFYRQAMLGGQPAATIEMANLIQASDTVRELPPIQGEHLGRWMQGWGL